MKIIRPRLLFDKYLNVYYKLKARLYRPFVGPEAFEVIVHSSLFPLIALKAGGARIGSNVRIGRNIHIHASGGSFQNLFIDEGTHIGKGVVLDITGQLTIGKRVGIGMFARIISHQNLGDSKLSEAYPPVSGDVVIPDDAVISSGTWYLYPTTIAEGTLISANSVVRGNYPSPCLLVGNPARVAQLFTPSSEDAKPEDSKKG